ncbi:MAG: nitrite reductase small subunit NirD [Gammaproteobacteria bacterium]
MQKTLLREEANEQNMESWIEVCRLENITLNDGVCCLIGSDQVAVFRTGDGTEIYAISNYDPFGNANVLSRGIVGDIQGKVVVASPLYKQHFCLQTGQCLEDETVSVQSYPIRVNAGMIEIQAGLCG